MATPNIVALDRLKAQLLTSGLQDKNQPLFQVINQLIDFLRQSIDLTAQQIAALTPPVVPAPSTTETNVTGFPPMAGDDYGDEPAGASVLLGPIFVTHTLSTGAPPQLMPYDPEECQCDNMAFVGNVIIP